MKILHTPFPQCLPLVAALLLPPGSPTSALAAQELQLPTAPTELVSDFARVLPAEQKSIMTRLIARVQSNSGGEIAIVTLPDIAGRDAGEVALQLGRTWGVGAKENVGTRARNMGIVVLLVPKATSRDGNGHIAISVGQGAEGFIPNAVADGIRREATPYLAAGDYGAGLALITARLAQRYAAEFAFGLDSTVAPPNQEHTTGIRPIVLVFIIAGLILLVALGSAWQSGRTTTVGETTSMHTPVFRFDASMSNKLLTCTVSGIDIPAEHSASISSGTQQAKPAHRTVQSQQLDDIAKSAGSLHAAFRACVDRRIVQQAELRNANIAAVMASALAIVTLGLLPSARQRAAESRARARTAANAVKGPLVRIEYRPELAMAWRDTVIAAGTRAVASQSIWDIMAQERTNQRRERSAASTSVTRELVTGSVQSPAFIETDVPLIHLGNANGHPIYIGPTFLLAGATAESCVIIDIRTVDVRNEGVRFHENTAVPTDATVVGHSWRYANKNGGPDRRFKDNYQIPIAQYHKVFLSTSSGFDEAFMFSNAETGKAFGISLQALVTLLRDMRMQLSATDPRP